MNTSIHRVWKIRWPWLIYLISGYAIFYFVSIVIAICIILKWCTGLCDSIPHNCSHWWVYYFFFSYLIKCNCLLCSYIGTVFHYLIDQLCNLRSCTYTIFLRLSVKKLFFHIPLLIWITTCFHRRCFLLNCALFFHLSINQSRNIFELNNILVCKKVTFAFY